MTKITLIKGDIIHQEVHAIVNSANRALRGGGGIDGAIHRGAGPELYEECVSLGGCNIGEAKITKGYNLYAKHIIHTVGPEYGYAKGQESELLKLCYLNTLNLAKEHNIKTIALPAISVGIFRYPLKEATEIAITTVREFIENEPEAFDEIRFIVFNDEIHEVYKGFV